MRYDEGISCEDCAQMRDSGTDLQQAAQVGADGTVCMRRSVLILVHSELCDVALQDGSCARGEICYFRVLPRKKLACHSLQDHLRPFNGDPTNTLAPEFTGKSPLTNRLRLSGVTIMQGL